MKLPSIALKSAMLCLALAVTGCSHEYHQGYGGAYQQAIKEGKTEFQARRIAEAAGNKADDDEDRYQDQRAAQAHEMLRSMQRWTVPGNTAPIPSAGGGSHLQSATGYTVAPVVPHSH